jgi:hypothetical protein
MLDVEDADDILDVAASDISIAKTPSSKKGATSDVWILYQIEAEMDLAFAVFCFFEDLHRITYRSFSRKHGNPTKMERSTSSPPL